MRAAVSTAEDSQERLLERLHGRFDFPDHDRVQHRRYRLRVPRNRRATGDHDRIVVRSVGG